MTTTIRRTEISGSEVVTVRSDDPYLLHPFQTYAITDDVCGHISHFSTEVAALS